MPRPIAGIKAVINREATHFTGKRRETDEELRERAKNALIASGKATLISLEDALLSLPGVKDVKIKERFHFARGQVKLGAWAEEVTLEKGARLVAQVTANGEAQSEKKIFETTELAALGLKPSFVTVQSLLEGKAGEVMATAGVSWSLQNPKLEQLEVSNPKPIVLQDFGIIEIFVDGVDFADTAAVKRLQTEIDRVRAAGVFVLLKPAIGVNLEAIFKIEINPNLRLTAQDRARIEGQVAEEIRQYITQRKMGEPLLLAQVIKNTLLLDGVDNLEDFTITIRKQQEGELRELTLDSRQQSVKRIDIEESERLYPQYICVASEIKPLPVHIHFKAKQLDSDKQQQVLDKLKAYFGQRRVGDKVEKGQLQQLIVEGAGELEILKLTPAPWCPRTPYTGEDVQVSFVEQAQLGEVFAYDKLLQITGALKLTLPPGMKEADKRAVKTTIQARLDAFLDRLPPEADVEFAQLVAIAGQVVPVQPLVPDDFRVRVGDQEEIDRISREKIEVRLFEKAQWSHLCLTGDVELVTVEITQLAIAATVTITVGEKESKNKVKQMEEEATRAAQQRIVEAVKNAVANFLKKPTVGEDVSYQSLKNALQNLTPEVNYAIEQLSLLATSLADERRQETPLAGVERDIHIRSVEMAVMQRLNDDNLQVQVTVNKNVIP
jgi:uncharacterized phage protein gp47/JayE